MTSTSIVNALRIAEVIKKEDVFSAQDVAAALERVRTDLAAGRIAVEEYVTERAAGTCYQEVLDAADEETHGTWKDGRPMFNGDFTVAYAYPALVYGIALGLCLADDAQEVK